MLFWEEGAKGDPKGGTCPHFQKWGWSKSTFLPIRKSRKKSFPFYNQLFGLLGNFLCHYVSLSISPSLQIDIKDVCLIEGCYISSRPCDYITTRKQLSIGCSELSAGRVVIMASCSSNSPKVQLQVVL